MFDIFKSLTLVTLLAAGAMPARAADIQIQNDRDQVVRVVSTAGLDLVSPADQAVLNHRLAVAAHKVCEEVMGGEAFGGALVGTCFTRALMDAHTQAQPLIARARSRSLYAQAKP